MAINFVPADAEDFEKPLISQLEGRVFLILDIRFNESSKGEYAIVQVTSEDEDTKMELEYRTSAKALLTQLHQIDKLMKTEDDKVRVKLVKEKGKQWDYFTFTSPEEEG